MSTLIEFAGENELKDGSMKKIEFKNLEILLARVDGKYYAVDNKCPHFGADLSKGKLEGTVVICSSHHSKFDLADGHVIKWTDWTGIKLSLAKVMRSPKALKAYAVTEEGNKILVSV